MKKRLERVILFTVVLLSLCCLFPFNTKALSKEITNTDINTAENFDVGSLSFTDITYKDYSNTSTAAFGLTGTMENHTDQDVTFVSTISYYDENDTLIIETHRSFKALPGTSDFNQMSNISLLNGYPPSDIKYYHLTIEIEEENTTGSYDNTPSDMEAYAYQDYVINAYDVNVVVYENNTLDITETITAYFNMPKHGLIRTIPLKNKVRRLDGSSKNNRIQVSNVTVDQEYSTSKSQGNYQIKIGSPNKTLTGEQTFTIKYTYNLGQDPMKNYDELYFNLIGNGWDTAIGNITFTITMPKEFDSSKLGFSAGEEGSTENDNVNYSVVGNQIKGDYDGILEAGESLTVRCELQEGYFVGAALIINYSDYFPFLIPVLCLFISFLLWLKFGKDDKVVETVEFYPPEGFNSLEVGFLYKGKADSKDVTSLLIYLANKGYIKIIEYEEKSLFTTKKEFKITKLKDYDGNNRNERVFLNGLFKGKKRESTTNQLEVTSTD